MNIQLERVKEKIPLKNVSEKGPLSLKHSMVAMIILSLASIFIQSFIQNGFFSIMHFAYLIYPVVVLLNALPVFCIMALVYFVCGKIWIGAAVAYLPLIILNAANYFKTVFRDEPLKMSDLMLVSEMQNITQNYEIKLSFGIVMGIALAAVAIWFAIKYCKSAKISLKAKAVGIVLTLSCMVLSYNFIYTDKKIYEDIPTFAVEYHDTDMARHHGMLYTLLVSADAAKYNMPEGYSDEKVEEILAQTASATVGEEKEKINVIAIMGEAFFDVNRGGIAQFENEINPYENYHRIKSEGYYGKLVVPGFGGSTESTEFEFLTGASQYLLDSGMPTAYKTYATQKSYSLVRYFKDNGYDAVAIHPGYAWFYNRKSSYANIGFDKFISREDMDEDAPKIYGYIEDVYTKEQIKNNYLEHFRNTGGKPYFSFTITIQNHGPYPDFDYGRDVIYKRPDGITDENFWIINNYLNGVRDTDELLGDICNFAAGRQEPVVVLFFGDHLPYMDEKIECFNALGYNISHREEEGLENKYTVEYVMWSNEAAKEIIGQVKTGEGPEISSGFLGAELLDYMDVKKSPYFDFVSAASKEINVITPDYYKMGDVKTDNPEGDKAELLGKYKILQYYNFRRYNKD